MKRRAVAFENILLGIVAALILTAFVFTMTSCSTLKKAKSVTKQEEKVRVDSTVTTKKDTLSLVHKDSVYTKREQTGSVNETIIEFDSAGGSFPLYTIDIFRTDTVDLSAITGKIKKITLRHTQTTDNLEGGRLTTETLSEGHDEITVSLQKKTDTHSFSKNKDVQKTMFPLWLWLIPIVLFLLYAAKRYFNWNFFFKK